MPVGTPLPTLLKIGLKMDCGIESNVKTVARFIPCGTILLRIGVISKKANKYTFGNFDITKVANSTQKSGYFNATTQPINKKEQL